MGQGVPSAGRGVLSVSSFSDTLLSFGRFAWQRSIRVLAARGSPFFPPRRPIAAAAGKKRKCRELVSDLLDFGLLGWNAAPPGGGQMNTITPSFVWDGGGSDNLWSTAANWQGDVAPYAGASVSFAGSTRTSPDVSVASLSSIVFAYSGFTLTGASFSARDSIQVDPGVADATVSANLNGVPSSISVAGGATLLVSGVISAPT
jgi:hypothetical protein